MEHLQFSKEYKTEVQRISCDGEFIISPVIKHYVASWTDQELIIATEKKIIVFALDNELSEKLLTALESQKCWFLNTTHNERFQIENSNRAPAQKESDVLKSVWLAQNLLGKRSLEDAKADERRWDEDAAARKEQAQNSRPRQYDSYSKQSSEPGKFSFSSAKQGAQAAEVKVPADVIAEVQKMTDAASAVIIPIQLHRIDSGFMKFKMEQVGYRKKIDHNGCWIVFTDDRQKLTAECRRFGWSFWTGQAVSPSVAKPAAERPTINISVKSEPGNSSNSRMKLTDTKGDPVKAEPTTAATKEEPQQKLKLEARDEKQADKEAVEKQKYEPKKDEPKDKPKAAGKKTQKDDDDVDFEL